MIKEGIRWGAVLSGLLAVLLGSGCEVDSSAENNVLITPSNVTLRKGQSQEFIAHGGFEYSWSLSNNGWGVLSAQRGPSTIYTRTGDPDTSNAIQSLTVISTLESGRTSGVSQRAEAYIVHP
jgi:hypothetical protein